MGLLYRVGYQGQVGDGDMCQLPMSEDGFNTSISMFGLQMCSDEDPDICIIYSDTVVVTYSYKG